MTLREEIIKSSGILEEGYLGDTLSLGKKIKSVLGKGQSSEFAKKLTDWIKTIKDYEMVKEITHDFLNFFSGKDKEEILKAIDKNTNENSNVNFISLWANIRYMNSV